jgi:biotin transport system substrate-specific component
MEKVNAGARPIPGIWVTGFRSLALITAMCLAAYVYIPLPFTPVPITLQTLFVLLGGIVLGRAAGLCQGIYIALGAFGLPVFTLGASGAARLFGPTGGYLIGFIGAALFVGLFYSPKYIRGLAVLAGATLIIYAVGVFQLWLVLRQPVAQVVLLGVLPFLPGDIIKLLAAQQIGHWMMKNRWLDPSP